MIAVVYNKRFLKSAAGLPETQRQQLVELIELVSENPYHPLLHTKHLTGELTGLLSFRITRDWRVVFQFLDQNQIQLLRVGHRKDIYK